MSTLAEIEAAVKKLPVGEKLQLFNSLGNALAAEQRNAGRPHSILEIPIVSVGKTLYCGDQGDLLDEMLEDRI